MTMVGPRGSAAADLSTMPATQAFMGNAADNVGSDGATTAVSPPFSMLVVSANIVTSNEVATIGPYMILRLLGQGSFAQVKEAVHVRTNERVAIKIIAKDRLDSPVKVRRILREVRFLRALYHPHIVRLYDVYESETHIYIVMEYANGGELFDYIVNSQRLRPTKARRFMRQIISALDYCHQNNIVHRDLKPENLLLDSSNNIKIADFGFSNVTSRQQLMTTFCGSPYYAPPEMNRGISYLGAPADVWSLGVIFYACLTGTLPFSGTDIGSLYRAIRRGGYVLPDYIDPLAAHLLESMLKVNPEERITMAAAARHPWTVEGYNEPINNYQPTWAPVVTPDAVLMLELLNHHNHNENGVAMEMSALTKIICTQPRHPLTTMYCLLDDSRARRLDSLTPTTGASSYSTSPTNTTSMSTSPSLAATAPASPSSSPQAPSFIVDRSGAASAAKASTPATTAAPTTAAATIETTTTTRATPATTTTRPLSAALFATSSTAPTTAPVAAAAPGHHHTSIATPTSRAQSPALSSFPGRSVDGASPALADGSGVVVAAPRPLAGRPMSVNDVRPDLHANSTSVTRSSSPAESLGSASSFTAAPRPPPPLRRGRSMNQNLIPESMLAQSYASTLPASSAPSSPWAGSPADSGMIASPQAAPPPPPPPKPPLLRGSSMKDRVQQYSLADMLAQAGLSPSAPSDRDRDRDTASVVSAGSTSSGGSTSRKTPPPLLTRRQSLKDRLAPVNVPSAPSSSTAAAAAAAAAAAITASSRTMPWSSTGTNSTTPSPARASASSPTPPATGSTAANSAVAAAAIQLTSRTPTPPNANRHSNRRESFFAPFLAGAGNFRRRASTGADLVEDIEHISLSDAPAPSAVPTARGASPTSEDQLTWASTSHLYDRPSSPLAAAAAAAAAADRIATGKAFATANVNRKSATSPSPPMLPNQVARRLSLPVTHVPVEAAVAGPADGAAAAAAAAAAWVASPADAGVSLRKPKVTGMFTLKTTSAKDRNALAKEVIRAAQNCGFVLTVIEPRRLMRYEDEETGTSATVEIVDLDKLALSGLKFRRISGNFWSYKRLVERLVEFMHI